MEPKTLVLIDGKNMLYRSHFSHRELASQGMKTGAIYGSLAGMLSMAKHLPDAAFAWVWDGDGKTWRHELSASVYKANRSIRPSDERKEALSQLPELKNLLTKMGFKNFEIEGLEGDDLVGILTTAVIEKNLFDTVLINSSDRDFYQLISKRVAILKGLDKQTGKLNLIRKAEAEAEFGIPLEKIIQLRALLGDSSDNILHMFKGVGPVTGAKLIQAGLDPSLPKFESMPKNVQWMFSKPLVIRGNAINFKFDWEKLHLNYKLTKIVTKDCEHFTKEVRGKVQELLSGLDKKSFLRKKTDSGWEYMTLTLGRMEMNALLERRQELWALP